MRSSPASQPRQQQCEFHGEQLIHKLLLAAHYSPLGCLQEQCVSKARSSIALPVSCPFTPSIWQRHSQSTEQQGSTTLPSTPSAAAAGGTQLTRAQPICTIKHPLPTSTGHTCSAEASAKSYLPPSYGDLQAASPHPSSSWESRAHSPRGKGSDKQFIWQRYPRLASHLQHWMDTPHTTSKSCGLGTEDYSCQTC